MTTVRNGEANRNGGSVICWVLNFVDSSLNDQLAWVHVF